MVEEVDEEEEEKEEEEEGEEERFPWSIKGKSRRRERKRENQDEISFKTKLRLTDRPTEHFLPPSWPKEFRRPTGVDDNLNRSESLSRLGNLRAAKRRPACNTFSVMSDHRLDIGSLV